ncbi:NAD-dependent epimerase [Allostella sp. ATCC 35155]|nr:NAD-dependent epimerase [Stella sp. ATCC 35155]
MATYLVTGGCGFIGSHLVDRLLALGHKVRVLDNLSTGRRENLAPAAELWVGDIADPATVTRALEDADGCFHLAAVASVTRSAEEWVATHRTNLTGTVTVLDAARLGRLPVVYASSAAVFGDASAPPLTEASPTQPLSAYGADKLACEHHAAIAQRVHGIRTVGARFFNVYGPRQDPRSPYSGVISIFCDRLRRGEPVTVFGDGGQSRDFVYVGDVVDMLVRAMATEFAEPEVFCVCTGRPTSIVELAATIADLLRRELHVHHAPPRAGDIRESLGSHAKAADRLGFRPQVSLAEGLQRTLQAA